MNCIKTPTQTQFCTFFLSLCFVLIATACTNNSQKITTIWTDQSEFVSYVELFNKSQNTHKIVVEYKKNPAYALLNSQTLPDLVIGPWLKGEKTRSKLIPVDYIFNELKIKSNLFYPQLLDLGNIRGRQYLLPVSFNLPALIFSPEHQNLITQDFSLSLEQIQTMSETFNTKKNNTYTRMGFSPRWQTDFLYLTAKLFDSRFEEGGSLFTFNKKNLEEAITFVNTWTKQTNTSQTAEDEFEFKYLYDPPYKLVTGNKNLFSYMSSDELLILPQDKLQNIDFRWISKNNKTPVNDEIIYAAICKKTKNSAAAEAFLIWFYSEKTQKELLERSNRQGTMDRTFGISGGFSSLSSVNEKIFPLYYPSLLGHLLPPNSLAVPQILPNNWNQIKEEIILPWLEAITSDDTKKYQTTDSLESKITSWLKAN